LTEKENQLLKSHCLPFCHYTFWKKLLQQQPHQKSGERNYLHNKLMRSIYHTHPLAKLGQTHDLSLSLNANPLIQGWKFASNHT